MAFKPKPLVRHLAEDDNRDLPMEDNRDLSEGVDHVKSTNAISTLANIGVVINVDDPNSKLHTDAIYY